jgi:hypothetical protein
MPWRKRWEITFDWIVRRRRELFISLLLFKGALALLRLAVFFRFQTTQWYNFVSYWDFASAARYGQWPYVHYWVEYPPVFPWFAAGLYALSSLGSSAAQGIFYALNALFLVAADGAILYLVFRLGQRLYGTRWGTLAALMQTVLFVPIYIYTGWFDTWPTALVLLSVLLVVEQRPRPAGIVVAVGALTKIFPLLVAPVAWLYFRSAQRKTFALWTTVTACAIALPLLMSGSTMTLASARGFLQRLSWETIWAVLEGYTSSGGVPAPAQRFDPQQLSWIEHATFIPGWLLIAALVVAITIVLLRAPRPVTARTVVILTGLLINLMLIFSKGYSPQYLTWVTPWLALLGIEYRRFWFLAAGLAAANLLEYPVHFHFFAAEQWTLISAVSARTVLLVITVLCQWRALSRPRCEAPPADFRQYLARPSASEIH